MPIYAQSSTLRNLTIPLLDVDQTSLEHNQILQYDDVSGKFKNQIFSYDREDILVTVTQSGADRLAAEVGDLITYDTVNNKYKFFEADDDFVLGTVIEATPPNLDTFRYNPAGELINISLNGIGPFFYFDNANPGKLTETKPTASERNIPVFFKLGNSRAIYFDGGLVGGDGGGLEDSVFSQGTLTVENGTSTFATFKMYVLYNTTADDTETELFLDGTDSRVDLPEDSTMMFEADIIGRDSSGTDHCAFRIQGLINKTSGSTVLVNTTNEVVIAETDETWSATVSADNVNDTIAVKVTGAAATTIRWTGFVKTTIVTH